RDEVFQRGGTLPSAPALDGLVAGYRVLAQPALLELVLHEPYAGPDDQAARHDVPRHLVLRAEMDLAELRPVDQLAPLAYGRTSCAGTARGLCGSGRWAGKALHSVSAMDWGIRCYRSSCNPLSPGRPERLPTPLQALLAAGRGE